MSVALPSASMIVGAAAIALSSTVTVVTIRQVYTNPQLRAQVEELYRYYTGQLPGIANNSSESENEQPLSESPQEILQNILSGDYRENQANQQTSPSVETLSGNGGAYI